MDEEHWFERALQHTSDVTTELPAIFRVLEHEAQYHTR